MWANRILKKKQAEDRISQMNTRHNSSQIIIARQIFTCSLSERRHFTNGFEREMCRTLWWGVSSEASSPCPPELVKGSGNVSVSLVDGGAGLSDFGRITEKKKEINAEKYTETFDINEQHRSNNADRKVAISRFDFQTGNASFCPRKETWKIISRWGQAVYLLKWSSLTKGLQTDPKKVYFALVSLDRRSQRFEMRFCNVVENNFQHYFVIIIGYCITKTCITSPVILSYKSLHNNRDIFCDEMVLIFFMNTITTPHVKRLSVWFIRMRKSKDANPFPPFQSIIN